MNTQKLAFFFQHFQDLSMFLYIYTHTHNGFIHLKYCMSVLTYKRATKHTIHALIDTSTLKKLFLSQKNASGASLYFPLNAHLRISLGKFNCKIINVKWLYKELIKTNQQWMLMSSFPYFCQHWHYQLFTNHVTLISRCHFNGYLLYYLWHWAYFFICILCIQYP